MWRCLTTFAAVLCQVWFQFSFFKSQHQSLELGKPTRFSPHVQVHIEIRALPTTVVDPNPHLGRLDPDEDFSCCLDVLYGGLGITKMEFLIKKYHSSCKFFQIFCHQNPGSGYGSALTTKCGSTTLFTIHYAWMRWCVLWLVTLSLLI
jgi:hypothetical protein